MDAITAAFAQALFEIRPQATFLTRVEAVLEVPGPERADAAELAPVRLSPHFPQPMVEPLSELAQDLVLPGLDKVPANTVLPLETNPAFVEAFMVGLNHEMGRELVWRGYPADLRATYFDRFWRTPYPVWPADIEHIAHWSDRSLTIGANDGNFVLLVRSELLKRYPNAVISASNQDTGEEKHPVFAGGFPPDVRYVGFDIPANEIAHWSIIIKEHPSAPRFGLRTDQPQSGAHASTLGETAAATAKAARIPPVRITLPPSMLSEVA